MAAVLVGVLVAHILIQLLRVHLFFTSNFSWKCFIGLHWPTINQTMIGYAMISGGKVQVLKEAMV